jgi:hypothetical protein
MAFDKAAGGHAFDFNTRACVKCGMSDEHYRDNGKPECTGQPIMKVVPESMRKID